mgnify:CR=1 FL=1
MTNGIDTEHHLDFEVSEWLFPEFKMFRVGTCYGLWRSTGKTYDILAIDNKEKGNGHLNDVLQWFEYSCRRDNLSLRVLELWNKRFMKHLIEKRGFKRIKKSNNVIKHFK